MKTICAVIPAALIGLVGCGGDQPSVAATLAGTWQLNDPTTMALTQQLTLGQGGSYALALYDTKGMVMEQDTGTYQVNGATVVSDATSNVTMMKQRVTTQFYAGQTMLAGPAALPVGSHQGIVGTFSSGLKVESIDKNGAATVNLQLTSTFVMKADNTVMLAADTGTPPVTTSSGTWADAGGGVYTLTVQGKSSNFVLIDDMALTNQPYHRLPAQ